MTDKQLIKKLYDDRVAKAYAIYSRRMKKWADKNLYSMPSKRRSRRSAKQ